jgi:hypothetical protein
MYLVQARSKRRNGYYKFYVLRETYWDSREKRQKQRYLAYIGPYPVISRERAKKIAKKLGINLEQLRRVRRLRILD